MKAGGQGQNWRLLSQACATNGQEPAASEQAAPDRAGVALPGPEKGLPQPAGVRF